MCKKEMDGFTIETEAGQGIFLDFFDHPQEAEKLDQRVVII